MPVDTGAARELMLTYVAAVAYVEVERPDGGRGIGTATHVGDSVYVTARHVVEGSRILEVGSTEHTYIRLGEGTESRTFVHDGSEQWPAHEVRNEKMTITAGPFFHPDKTVDLAAFVVDGADPLTPWVRLGGHLDDWLGGTDFVLSEVVVMGYPPIPMTQRPYLFASRAEVNAQVDFRDTPHVHWLLSTPARGGFSGSMVINEQGLGLGVVSRSVVTNGDHEIVGFMSAVSVEPIYSLLAHAKILPARQAKGFDGLWDEDAT